MLWRNSLCRLTRSEDLHQLWYDRHAYLTMILIQGTPLRNGHASFEITQFKSFPDIHLINVNKIVLHKTTWSRDWCFSLEGNIFLNKRKLIRIGWNYSQLPRITFPISIVLPLCCMSIRASQTTATRRLISRLITWKYRRSAIPALWESLQWRHNGRDSVSNHQPHDCFLNRLFRQRSNKTSKPRVTGLFAGNSPEAGEFPAQMTSNAENVSIWWRHHANDNWTINAESVSISCCHHAWK